MFSVRSLLGLIFILTVFISVACENNLKPAKGFDTSDLSHYKGIWISDEILDYKESGDPKDICDYVEEDETNLSGYSFVLGIFSIDKNGVAEAININGRTIDKLDKENVLAVFKNRRVNGKYIEFESRYIRISENEFAQIQGVVKECVRKAREKDQIMNGTKI